MPSRSCQSCVVVAVGPQLWHDATTFSPYYSETACAEADGRGRADLQSSGIAHVLQSLTSNHRAILKALADVQLEQMDALAVGGGDDDDDDDGDNGDGGGGRAGEGEDDGDAGGGGGGSSSGGRVLRTRRVVAPRAASRGRPASGRSAVAVTGLEFAKLFEVCSEKLLVSTDDALRTVLVELKVWRGAELAVHVSAKWCGRHLCIASYWLLCRTGSRACKDAARPRSS